ncbi:MAG: amidohydrolase [Flavobacteriaceae bacterium]
MKKRRPSLPITAFFGLLILSAACTEETHKATLVITNARIWTGNSAQPWAEAMAISGDTLEAIGTMEAIKNLIGDSTKVEDLKGKFVSPGFIDCHVHLMSGGNGLLGVQLRDADTPEAFAEKIAAYAKSMPPGAWIVEGNWDHTLWGGALPEKEWVDADTPEHPVAVLRLDGHMLLANSAALRFAGIDKATPDVEGGEIVRNPDGTPTGILKDNAMNLVFDKIPPMNDAQKEKIFKAAMAYLLSNGVTSVHDVDGLSKTMESYGTAMKLKEQGQLSLRIYAAAPLSNWEALAAMERQDDKWLKVGVLKGFVDGSLGSHTAAFDQPYTDKPTDKGFFINSETDLYDWISKADKADLKLMVHAIGDRAIHTLLDIYERVESENGKKDRRLRIEHAQHIAPTDIDRFAELGVVASMQPYHAIDDGRWAEALIGPERIKTTYAFKSLFDSKATVAFGSDWFVAPATPLEGIYAAATRRTLDGKNPAGWVPDLKITVQQALTAYTVNAAYASFDETTKGSLEVGKLADFVVISEDLTQGDPVRIKDLEILATYVGGQKVFEPAGLKQ